MQAERQPTRTRRSAPPLDAEGLERLGLFYAGRYATTRAKLADYLRRKLRERGWSGAGAPPVEALVERFAALGYVDDAAFAAGAERRSLLRRGYGERRVAQALRAAGIGGEDAAPARREAERSAEDAALRFARRRRIGPYADAAADGSRGARGSKAAAAMLRAGHRHRYRPPHPRRLSRRASRSRTCPEAAGKHVPISVKAMLVLAVQQGGSAAHDVAPGNASGRDRPAATEGRDAPRPEDEALVKLTGTMKWFDATRGFGFLVSDQAKGDILVHFSVLKEHDRRSLPEGAIVECLVAEQERGLQARKVLSIDLSQAVDAGPAARRRRRGAARAGRSRPPCSTRRATSSRSGSNGSTA